MKEHNVRLIGTTAETIKKAEDRQEFKDTMEKIHEPVAASKVVDDRGGRSEYLPRRSAIRLYFVRLIPWAAAAAVLPTIEEELIEIL